LQENLHSVNRYVKGFKTVIETLLSYSTDTKVIIRADQKPSYEHRGRFNAPQSDEVAILIVSQEFTKRDIIRRARHDTPQRVNALQYPMMFCRVEDRYSINILQVDPTTRENLQVKTISAMN